MNDELLFRLIFISVFVLCLLISASYRRLARKTGEVIPRQQEGFIVLTLRIVLTLPLLLTILLYACNPRWMDWSAVSLPDGVRWLGAVCGIACIPLLRWVFISIGANISETVLTKGNHVLVTHGPYRRVRHPLYSLGLLEILSLSLLSANWFMLLMWLIAVLLFRFIVIPKEEANLVTVFAGEYQSYRERTGALVPHF